MVRRLVVALLALAACGAPAELAVRTEQQPAVNRTRLATEFETPTTTTTTIPPRVVGSPRASRSRHAARVSPPSRAPHVTQGGAWDALAGCESGGNWAANTGNGYFGGLQMDMSFWRSYGGDVAPRPDLASRDQQITAAEKARDGGRGYHPWPSCARRLGLI